MRERKRERERERGRERERERERERRKREREREICNMCIFPISMTLHQCIELRLFGIITIFKYPATPLRVNRDAHFGNNLVRLRNFIHSNDVQLGLPDLANKNTENTAQI